MPIVFDCECGKTLKVPDEHAGKRVKCPVCNGISFVPGGEEPVFEVIEKPPAPRLPRKAKVEFDDDDDDDRGYAVKKRTRDEEEAEEEQREERKRLRRKERRRSRRPRPDEDSDSSSGGIINSGVVGGIISMLIAVVVIVVLLSFGRISIFPIILFVLGFIGFIKGLVTGK